MVRRGGAILRHAVPTACFCEQLKTMNDIMILFYIIYLLFPSTSLSDEQILVRTTHPDLPGGRLVKSAGIRSSASRKPSHKSSCASTLNSLCVVSRNVFNIKAFTYVCVDRCDRYQIGVKTTKTNKGVQRIKYAREVFNGHFFRNYIKITWFLVYK